MMTEDTQVATQPETLIDVLMADQMMIGVVGETRDSLRGRTEIAMADRRLLSVLVFNPRTRETDRIDINPWAIIMVGVEREVPPEVETPFDFGPTEEQAQIIGGGQ